MSKPLSTSTAITHTDPTPSNPKDELINAVRHYVHFDNLAETLTKQVTNARSMRAEFETKVITMLEAQGMKHAVLQINGATLQRQTRFQSTNLSWSFLEEQLHEYYKIKGRPDETSAILEFIQKRRGGKSIEYLKKTLPAATGPGGRT